MRRGTIGPDSQEGRIREFLRAGRALTSLDALRLFGCLRLSGRILELRRAGEPIASRMIRTPSGKQVAEYFYETGGT